MLKFVALSVFLCTVQGADWNYQNDQGADWWKIDRAFRTCADDDQSPIDLTPATATDVFTAVPFIFSEGWNLPQNAEIVNNGHTIQMNILGSDQGTCGANMPQVTGSTMGNKVYEVAQFHLHWGNDSTAGAPGSEHTLDGAYYPAELHIVTWNTKDYATLGDAFNSGEYGSLAVLGFFLEISGGNSPPLNFINSKNIGQLIEPGSSITTGIDLAALLKGINTYEFYHYRGSLTTPPCHEAVVWNVFEDTIPITVAELDLLKTMKDNDGFLMGDNYREILPLGRRELFHFSKEHDPAYCFPAIQV